MCSAALGTPVDPEVNSATAMSVGRAGEEPAADGGPGLEDVHQVVEPAAGGDERPGPLRAAACSAAAMTSTGCTWSRAACDLGGAQPVVERGGDGPEPPARPVEEEGGSPVGQLPAHDVAAPHPGRRQPAGQGGDGGLDGRGVETARAVDDRRPGPPDSDGADAAKDSSSAPRSHAPPGRR